MTPQPLPLPPRDRARLADFPVVAKDRLPERLWRVHKVVNEPEYFACDGAGRWDPPVESGELFGACYTSTDPLGAFIETFAELPIITRGEIDRRALAQMALPPEPRWANMLDGSVVGRWGLDERISVGEDYDTCQRWSEALFSVGFNGVLYRARHDVGGWRPSVALFDNPGYQPTRVRLLDTAAIPTDLVREAEEHFGIEVWPSIPLRPEPSLQSDDDAEALDEPPSDQSPDTRPRTFWSGRRRGYPPPR